MKTVELYDTTLRDGTQQQGISLSVEDKLAITQRLDMLGVEYIEGGYAGANPKDDEFFSRVGELDLHHAQVTAFGSTRRADTDASEDPALNALADCPVDVVTIVGKASAFQVRTVLECSLEENLAMVADSVRYLVGLGKRVFFDAEHFFDGHKGDPEYALQVLRVAAEAGAERLVLCDTNGGTLPSEVAAATRAAASACSVPLGIHTHNDTETAVAAALAALDAGALQVQGTMNGYGERCGNANLASVIANLKLKLGVDCVSDAQLASLTEVSNYVAEVVNRRPFPFQPYVGANAFSHKGGLHAAATEKTPHAYQHVTPESVGNAGSVVISELAGRGNVVRRIRELGLDSELDSVDARKIVGFVKEQEARGYTYEHANASFELVVRRALPNYEPLFELIDFMVLVENRRRSSFGVGWRDSGAEHPMLSEATIKVRVGEELMHTAAEGNGPVDALDNALRKALIESYPDLSRVRLTDYKVRVVNEGAGTGAMVRVLIESADDRSVWNTVGASSNILEASWSALADSLEWWLINRGYSAHAPSSEDLAAAPSTL